MGWEALKEATKTSISDVLETMFFLPLELSESKGGGGLSQTPKDQLMGVGLKFSGPMSGEVVILLPIKLARSLTADFLGQENAGVGTSEMEGTVKELVNMITGKALSLFDEGAIFKLGIPEAAEPAAPIDGFFSEDDNAFTLLFNAIEHQLALRITIGS